MISPARCSWYSLIFVSQPRFASELSTALTDPYVDGESAVCERAGLACDGQHLVDQITRKEQDGIVIRFHDVPASPPIINGETAAGKFLGLCMNVVDT